MPTRCSRSSPTWRRTTETGDGSAGEAESLLTAGQGSRLSRKPDAWRYAWDTENHLTAGTTPDGAQRWYRSDPLGRRTAKQRRTADG